jgi:hypothetical protein
MMALFNFIGSLLAIKERHSRQIDEMSKYGTELAALS